MCAGQHDEFSERRVLSRVALWCMEAIMAKQQNKDAASKPKLKRKAYEEELRRLHVELCRLREWVKHNGQHAVVVFEGRAGTALMTRLKHF